MGNSFLSHLGGGGDAGKSQQSTPVIPIKGWKGPEEACPSSSGPGLQGRGRSPRGTPIHAPCCASPADGK